jgi:diguanylate cyclase (GGDEF)-like protein
VLFLDLDNFKKVNDTEGHEAGDQLLIQVTQRINNRLRKQDTLARLGGDEFIILLEKIDSKEAVVLLCNDLLEMLATPFKINRRNFFVSSSVGVSFYPTHDKDAEGLIRKADLSMYQAKNAGRNNYKLYSPEFETDALSKLDVENDLRFALEKGELTFYYQPLVNLNDLKVVKVESLIRWFKPDGSMIPPDIFIPVAEQCGLISKIGFLAIDCACRQLAQWQAMGFDDLQISVNLSSIEFQDNNLLQNVQQSLRLHNCQGNKLIIEVTESLFMEDKSSVQHTMLALKNEGVVFALDDFGTGYSSFSYLQDLPISFLKIDKSFLKNVCTNARSAAIARTIIDVGINLGLEVVAEGIEDLATLNYVKDNGCKFGQGYFLHRPMSVENLTALLHKQKKIKAS